MRTIPFALLVITALLPASATPQPTSAASPPSTTTITPPSSYYLQSRVIVDSNNNHGDKDGLYVSNFHTGAGTADLTLQPVYFASPAFFNSGYQEFNLDPPEPFGITLGDYDNGGTGWNFLTTAPGYGDGGFFFNETGLQSDGAGFGGFGGWLACDWWHGVPQLFWRDAYLLDISLPETCARVELLPVAI